VSALPTRPAPPRVGGAGTAGAMRAGTAGACAYWGLKERIW
jgi:hypothetical protein